jgi:hypothetical protein
MNLAEGRAELDRGRDGCIVSLMKNFLFALGVALLASGCGGEREDVRKSKEPIGGQIFIVTEGRENIKLGLVKVKVFDVTSIERIRKEANATLEERLASVNVDTKWNDFKEDWIDSTIDVVVGDDVVTSDADGRFIITPPGDKFILAAISSRKILGEKKEKYRWLNIFSGDEIDTSGLLLSNHNQFKINNQFFDLDLATPRFEEKLNESLRIRVEEETARKLAQGKEATRKLAQEEEAYQKTLTILRAEKQLEEEKKLVAAAVAQKAEQQRMLAAAAAEEERRAAIKAEQQRRLVEEQRRLAFETAARKKTMEDAARKRAQFLAQTSLKLYRKSISDVSMLANRTNLTNLDLGANKITNIAPLANLTNLTSLHLSHNQITDVTALAGLTKLETLELLGNRITNITPLAKLTNLKLLDLRQNQHRNRNLGDSIPYAQKVMITKALPNCKIFFGLRSEFR